MVLLPNLQQIAIIQEAVAGTAETLAAANVIFHAGEATWEPDVVITARESMSASLSKTGVVPGTRAAKISFKMHLRGTTLAPTDPANLPDFNVPFQGCGAEVTVSGSPPNEQSSYKPDTALIVDETTGPYCTLGIYEGGKTSGKRYMIHGAVGNCRLTFEGGLPVLAEFDFTGIYNTPTDVSMLVPTYPTVIEPVFLSAALALYGETAVNIKTLTLDFGNEIAMRSNPNNAGGFHSAQIVNRKPVGTYDPEEKLAGTKNYHADFLSGTTGSITTGVFPSTGDEYNQLQLTVPKAQRAKVGLGNRDGVLIAPHDFECQRNSDAGDDEWELIQT